jgi:hypothetical protein
MGKVAEAQELKGLQVQLAKARGTAQVLQAEVGAAQRKHQLCLSSCRALEARIIALQTEAPSPIVSEHALLRYLERVKGVDFAALRAEIMDEGTAAAIAFAQTGRIKKNGLQLVFKDRVVVTVE